MGLNVVGHMASVSLRQIYHMVKKIPAIAGAVGGITVGNQTGNYANHFSLTEDVPYL